MIDPSRGSITHTGEFRVPTSVDNHARVLKAARASARLRQVDGLARHIERVVDAMPPLTDRQRARLAALLNAGPVAE